MANKDLKGTDGILGLSEVTENKLIWRMVIAEFLGTLLLVFIGCGSIVVGETNFLRIGLTFGLTIATLAQSIGHVSGCHINPAISLSFFVTGDIKLIRTLLFIVAQLIGAIAGAALLKVIIPDGKEGLLGITNISNGVTDVQGFVMEIILTFLLIFVIHAVCDDGRKDIKGSAPLAIGLSITACHLCGIPYSGSSVNPARSFGPAVIIDAWDNHWIYWAGPILGGLLAGLIYKFIFKVQKSDSDSYDF